MVGPSDQGDGSERPSLLSPLLSGRSLEPLHKQTTRSKISEHRGVVLGILVLVLLIGVVVGAKVLAERSADSATADRAEALEQILDGSTPRDFLAFNAGVKTPGSLAQRVRNEDGFVNVKAVADSATIRFQPSGWWSGFTERCIVAVVTEADVTVSVPKVACVRVNERGS